MFSVRNSRNFPDGAKIHNRALLSNYPRGFFAAQAYTMHKNSYLWQSKQCHVEQSGEFLLKEFYLMLKTADGGLHKLRMEREVNAREVLAYLEEREEAVRIGFDCRDRQGRCQ